MKVLLRIVINLKSFKCIHCTTGFEHFCTYVILLRVIPELQMKQRIYCNLTFLLVLN